MIEGARFIVVALVGLFLDLTVAWCTARVFGLPLWLAASMGFVVAAATNYLLHELWTFFQVAQKLSVARAARYSVALAATLFTRVATISTLTILVDEAPTLLVLLAGAGISFFVNYLVSKHLVFRPATTSKESVP